MESVSASVPHPYPVEEGCTENPQLSCTLSCECLHVEHMLQVTHVTVLEKPWDRRGSASLQQVSQAWLWSEGRVKGCEMGH